MTSIPNAPVSSATAPNAGVIASPSTSGRPRSFVEELRSRYLGHECYVRLTRSRATPRAVELRAEACGSLFAGESTAIFRRGDLECFVEDLREFATGHREDGMVQGGVWHEGNLMEVLCGLHAYRPMGDPERAALRVVVGDANSDDLMTVTVTNDPIRIAQFADELAALLDDARPSAMLERAP